VISNVGDVQGLTRAKSAGIPVGVISHRGKSREDFDAEIDDALKAAGVEVVCLAGFMRILSDGFVRDWQGKLLNIHPSLLPAYKGTNVHARVLAAGEKQSGASVHFVVPELDGGPVIGQTSVPVMAGDTPESLASRVLEVEQRLYPTALRMVCAGKVRLVDGAAVFTAS
jgi:phosphoribosylglycinamide formyltransferase-1